MCSVQKALAYKRNCAYSMQLGHLIWGRELQAYDGSNMHLVGEIMFDIFPFSCLIGKAKLSEQWILITN